MLPILITYDDEDADRGEYFNASQKDLISKILPDISLSVQSVNTSNCLKNSIDFYAKQHAKESFIFIAYVHGSEDALFIGKSEIINSHNATLFNQSLFYACSCYSAKELGQVLVNNGCRVFIGYNNTITTVNPETEPFFYECENIFIAQFLATENTIQKCLELMYDKYQEMTIYLTKYESIFDAGVLEKNSYAFEIICDKAGYSLTKNDFKNPSPSTNKALDLAPL